MIIILMGGQGMLPDLEGEVTYIGSITLHQIQNNESHQWGYYSLEKMEKTGVSIKENRCIII